MKHVHSFITNIIHFIHHYLIWIILCSYFLAALFPEFGLWIRDTHLGSSTVFNIKLEASLPLLMLATLLFNAGLGVNIEELSQVLKKPKFLICGLIGNWLIPVCLILFLSVLLKIWHDSEEVQQILVGLALIAAMPIAGASTAWSQNANGNLALSLGLVLFTTLLSPIFTPLIFHIVGLITIADYSEDLHELASGGVVSFLSIWVVLPSLLGIATRSILGDETIEKSKLYLKLINYFVLILLNYSNAALTLPKAIAKPDIDLLIITFIIVSFLCASAFYSAYYLAKYFHANRKNTISLMFGLGMNNNGTALVLASVSLTDHPEVMLPIIIYNLVQHLVASIIDGEVFYKFS